MPFKRGNKAGVGNAGPRKHKPYREALLLEIALAEQGKPSPAKEGSLRWIARQQLIRAGSEATDAKEVADRLDGKPVQDSSVTIERRAVRELTDAELDELLAEAAGVGEETAPIDPTQLN